MYNQMEKKIVNHLQKAYSMKLHINMDAFVQALYDAESFPETHTLHTLTQSTHATQSLSTNINNMIDSRHKCRRENTQNTFTLRLSMAGRKTAITLKGAITHKNTPCYHRNVKIAAVCDVVKHVILPRSRPRQIAALSNV